jgi:predicted ribosome quality control (RQC) complex YloA/Tae2 family protein
MSSFDIAAVLLEISEHIEGARINNIYQITPKRIVFKLHRPDQPKFFLLIEAGKRIHKTRFEIEKPLKPPDFCMILRKNLRNAIIKEINQQDFERIVTIKALTKDAQFNLIIELFDEGNIILTNEKNEILHALTYKKMRDREIKRSTPFQLPPSSGKNPLTITIKDIEELKNFKELEAVKALTKILGIGGLYAEEIFLRANIDKNIQCESLTKEDIEKIHAAIKDIIAPLTQRKITPYIVINEKNQFVDAIPFFLKKYEKLQLRHYPSFNEALDDYYTETELEEKRRKKVETLKKEIKKYERIIEAQKKALEDMQLKIEKNKNIGNIIYMHLHELQQLIERIRTADKKTVTETISKIEEEKKIGASPAKYFHSLNQEKQLLQVNIDNTTFPLLTNQTASANAQKYYTKAKKAEKKLQGIKKSIKGIINRIEELKNKMREEERLIYEKKIQKISKKRWYEKFRWFHSSDGNLVIGGKDATTNEILIKKYTEPHDIIFHADLVGAPIVIIKTSGKKISEQTLKEAAEFAASYSRAWREKIGTLNVYWVSPEQVSKTPPSGEYLSKGAFMIHGRKNYVRNVRLAIAIGIIFENEETKVIGGPKTAIEKQTALYTEIAPGELPSHKLAKQIIQTIAKNAPSKLKETILKIPLEEIQQFIPYGKGQLASSS